MREQAKIKLLAFVHRQLYWDLKGDIETNTVKEISTNDWQEGWNKHTFAPSIIVDGPEKVILTSQLLTYQKAMEFHDKRASELEALITDETPNVHTRLIEDKNLCDVCKFGSEPDLDVLLDFLLFEEVRLKKEVPA